MPNAYTARIGSITRLQRKGPAAYRHGAFMTPEFVLSEHTVCLHSTSNDASAVPAAAAQVTVTVQ